MKKITWSSLFLEFAVLILALTALVAGLVNLFQWLLEAFFGP